MTDDTVTVRRAIPADADVATALARSAKATWPYPAIWLAEWQEELTLTPANFQEQVGFLAELAGVPVGVCLLESHKDYWELSHLWVDPGAQRRGAGRALLRAVGGHMQRHAIASCRIQSDPYAEPFYLGQGARRIGEVPSPMPGAPDRSLPLMEWPAPRA